MRTYRRNVCLGVILGCGPVPSLRPSGGCAPAAADAGKAPGGALVPVQGCTEWQHGQRTAFLPASLPWPSKHILIFITVLAKASQTMIR